MQKLWKIVPALAIALVISQITLAPAAMADDAEARKAKILANLKLEFPQLDKVPVVMGDIAASSLGEFDEGSFTVNGQSNQKFLITKDDKSLYLIAGEPIDVSRSAEEINAAIAKRKEEEAMEASKREAELAASIEGLPRRGNPDGAITIIEFSDFQCPYCTRGAKTVEEILEKYPNDVNFVFKHFPLGFHPWAKPAAIASNCAGNQNDDAFWLLHDKFFEKQKELNPGNVMAKSKEFLADAKIDLAKWSDCAENQESSEYKAAAASVDADMAFGQKMGVSGTPGFFVNGRFLNGAQPIGAFEPIIQEILGASSDD